MLVASLLVAAKYVFQAMDRGECNAAIIDELAWELAQGGAYSLPENGTIYKDYANPARYQRRQRSCFWAGFK